MYFYKKMLMDSSEIQYKCIVYNIQIEIQLGTFQNIISDNA